jgi:hypothetical protein
MERLSFALKVRVPVPLMVCSVVPLNVRVAAVAELKFSVAPEATEMLPR